MVLGLRLAAGVRMIQIVDEGMCSEVQSQGRDMMAKERCAQGTCTYVFERISLLASAGMVSALTRTGT